MISIITPAYNAGKFIETLLSSVVNQPKNAELIIVDDGSTDDTATIVERWVKKYPSQILLVKKDNGGTGQARNVGIGKAHGDWIIFLDSDDLLLKESITQSLENYLETCEDDIVYTAKSYINMDLSSDVEVSFPEEKIEHFIPKMEFWTCIFRRKFLLDNNIKFFEYQKQDIETSFRFRAFSRTKKIAVEPAISFYLQRNNSDSNTHNFNYYALYSIKAKVYYEMLHELDSVQNFCSNTDKAFLRICILKTIYDYFEYIKNYGFDTKEDTQQIKDVLSLWQMHKNDGEEHLFEMGIKDAARWILWCWKIYKLGVSRKNYFNTVKKVDIKREIVKKDNVKENTKVIMDRLTSVTNDVRKICASKIN